MKVIVKRGYTREEEVENEDGETVIVNVKHLPGTVLDLDDDELKRCLKFGIVEVYYEPESAEPEEDD